MDNIFRIISKFPEKEIALFYVMERHPRYSKVKLEKILVHALLHLEKL